MGIHCEKASYLTSATTVKQLPSDIGVEVAFIGRSNAGKSSAINVITNVRGLARTSATPGRTQMINFFSIDERHRLVDLPGYGYAKTTKTNKARWDQMTSDYFEVRKSLAGLVLVMDSRHPLKEMDDALIAWCVEMEMPLHILLTKADKLSKDAQKKTLFFVQKAVSMHPLISVQLFSALKKMGIEAAKERVEGWLRHK